MWRRAPLLTHAIVAFRRRAEARFTRDDIVRLTDNTLDDDCPVIYRDRIAWVGREADDDGAKGDDAPPIETVKGVGYRLVPPPRERLG